MSERLVIGEIFPAEDERERPTFRIIREHESGMSVGPNVRACAHSRYVLDDKWNTVTCDSCGERLSAYAVLRDAAAWEEKRKRDIQSSNLAEKSLHEAELRRLSRLRATTETERAEIAELLRRRWSATLEEMRDTARRIGALVRERQYASRAERRARRKRG